MDEKTLRALVAAAVRKIDIIAAGARFHVEASTPNGAVTAETRSGKVKTWVSLDAAARWVRNLGIGAARTVRLRWLVCWTWLDRLWLQSLACSASFTDPPTQ